MEAKTQLKLLRPNEGIHGLRRDQSLRLLVTAINRSFEMREFAKNLEASIDFFAG